MWFDFNALLQLKTEVLVVVSDLHCGSVVGLAPPETTTKHGNITSKNYAH